MKELFTTLTKFLFENQVALITTYTKFARSA